MLLPSDDVTPANSEATQKQKIPTPTGDIMATTGILDLEQDALVLICTLLPVRDLCSFSQACRRSRGAAQEVRCGSGPIDSDNPQDHC
jgi:hypothetical protein